MPEFIPNQNRRQDIAGAYANSGKTVGFYIDFEINLIPSDNNDAQTSYCDTCIVDENGVAYTKNGNNCWIIPSSSGGSGGGPFTVSNVSGVYTITDTASSNSFVIDTNDAIPSIQLVDADADTSVILVEDASDSIVFTVDGKQVMTLDATKLSLSGIFIDPPTGIEFKAQSSVPSAAGVPNNTLWINSSNNHLYRGSTDLEDSAVVSGIYVTPVVKKAAGDATITISDLNKFIVVEPSGSSTSIILPDVGISEVDYFVDIFNNGLVNATIVVAGGDTFIGNTLIEDGNGGSLKVTADGEWIAVGTGKILPAPYTESFVTGDWLIASGVSTDYEYTVLATTHGLGASIKIVQVYNSNGDIWQNPDINVNKSTGTVVLSTASGTAFDGDVIINACL